MVYRFVFYLFLIQEGDCHRATIMLTGALYATFLPDAHRMEGQVKKRKKNTVRSLLIITTENSHSPL